MDALLRYRNSTRCYQKSVIAFTIGSSGLIPCTGSTTKNVGSKCLPRPILRWSEEGVEPEMEPSGEVGGAKRDRTADLLNAIQALSQLSYGPTLRPGLGTRRVPPAGRPVSGAAL